MRVWPLSNDHALLMTDITRFKTDGSVLETGRYCYMLRRAAPSWQITGVTGVDYTQFNLDDENDFYNFTGYHASEHAAIRTALGITT